MNTSIVVGSIALVLAGVLATGHAFGRGSHQARAAAHRAGEDWDQREALRRAAVLDQQKRKDEFARNCLRPALSDSQLERRRAAYRKL